MKEIVKEKIEGEANILSKWLKRSYLILAVVEIAIIVLYCIVNCHLKLHGIERVLSCLFYYAVYFWKEYGFELTFAYSAICIVFPSLKKDYTLAEINKRLRFPVFKIALGMFLFASISSCFAYSILYEDLNLSFIKYGFGLYCVGFGQLFLYFALVNFIPCFLFTLHILFQTGDKSMQRGYAKKCCRLLIVENGIRFKITQCFYPRRWIP